MAKLKVKRFDVERHVKLGSTIVLIGRRGSGKSTLLRDIAYCLHKAGKIDVAIGMSPTEGSTSSMADYILPSCIYSTYREDIVDRLLETQRKQWARGHGKEVALFLDDIGYDKKIFSSETLRQLWMNGRHRHVSVVLAVQYSMTLPPALRSNSDIIIACRDPIVKSRRNLHEHFFGNFSEVADFERCLAALTEDYGVMVAVNNQRPSNVITDSIFHYKARLDLPRFSLCSSAMKKLHARYYDADRRETETRATTCVDVPISMRKIVRAGTDGATLRTGF